MLANTYFATHARRLAKFARATQEHFRFSLGQTVEPRRLEIASRDAYVQHVAGGALTDN